MKSIKDLIYFDLEKARSLVSQFAGGLISEISRAFEDEGEISTGAGFDIKVVKGNIGGKSKERVVKTEKVELYHELLNEVEKQLSDYNSLSDINSAFDGWEGSPNEFIGLVPEMNYIKAKGWSTFEDFDRFKRIFSNFNDIQRLIFQPQVENNPEVLALRQQLKEARESANQNKDRNAKTKELKRIQSNEKRLDRILESQTDIHLLDEEFIYRVKLLLDTFSPERLNFRLLPLPNLEDFQILASLKEKYIVDGSFENIIYTYGSRPNIELTILGVITSAPRMEDTRVDPDDEFLSYSDEDLDEVQKVDKALRRVFTSFEEFEKFFFVPSFPKIAVSPIAIYREVILKGK